MSSEELVTIIVPVYNVEKYLAECLDSLQRQSYRNLEVILVNDGSTDHSADICKEYCEKDQRFCLIEQENTGLGGARNAGLERANGKYICFVDSDDYVHESFIEVLYNNLIEYQADISMCNYMRFSGEQPMDQLGTNRTMLYDKKKMLQDIICIGEQERSERIVISWNKLIRAEAFQNLRFQNKIHEDEFMINDYILWMDKAVWTDMKLYYYRQRADSITGCNHKNDLCHLDALEAKRIRMELFSGNEYQMLYNDILRSYFENASASYFMLKDENNKWQLISRIYPQYFSTLIRYWRKLRGRQRVHYALFLLSPTWYYKHYWK